MNAGGQRTRRCDRKKTGTAEIRILFYTPGSQEKGNLSLLGSRALQAEKAVLLKCSSSQTSSPQLLQQLRGGRARMWHLSVHLSLHGLFLHFLGSTYWQRLSLILPRAGTGSAGRAKGRLCSLLSTSSSARPAFRALQWDIVLPGLRATVWMGWGRGHYFFVQWEPAIWNKLL